MEKEDGDTMDAKEFKKLRKHLGKTQKEMARLLGTSIKAIHSYEQQWRTIPPHAERQILFLTAKKNGRLKKTSACWAVRKCPKTRKLECPAWEFRSGNLCWFINGTICDGKVYKKWKDKMALCRRCNVFNSIFQNL